MSITDYIDKMKNIIDNLVLAKKLVKDDDLITLILNGVGHACEATVNSVQAMDTSISLDDLIGLLLSVEMRYQEKNSVQIDQTTIVLYSARNKSSNQKGKNCGQFGNPRSQTHHQVFNRKGLA